MIGTTNADRIVIDAVLASEETVLTLKRFRTALGNWKVGLGEPVPETVQRAMMNGLQLSEGAFAWCLTILRRLDRYQRGDTAEMPEGPERPERGDLRETVPLPARRMTRRDGPEERVGLSLTPGMQRVFDATVSLGMDIENRLTRDDREKIAQASGIKATSTTQYITEIRNSLQLARSRGLIPERSSPERTASELPEPRPGAAPPAVSSAQTVPEPARSAAIPRQPRVPAAPEPEAKPRTPGARTLSEPEGEVSRLPLVSPRATAGPGNALEARKGRTVPEALESFLNGAYSAAEMIIDPEARFQAHYLSARMLLALPVGSDELPPGDPGPVPEALPDRARRPAPEAPRALLPADEHERPGRNGAAIPR